MESFTSISLYLSIFSIFANYVLVGGVTGRTGAAVTCVDAPCQNGGSCYSVRGGTYGCQCPAYYTGELCQSYINPCSNSPCQNGGSCMPPTASAEWYCICPPNLSGRTCEISLVCLNSPCNHGGTCVANGTGRTCLCHSFTIGVNCEIITLPLDEMTPTFGPHAGGTQVTITSSVPVFHLMSRVDAKVEYHGSQGKRVPSTGIILSNRTLSFFTKPLAEVLQLQPEPDWEYTVSITIYIYPLQRLQLRTWYLVTTNFTFTYKRDPVILSVFPLESIRAGGTDLTVHGRHLKSVNQIVMLIRRVDRGNMYLQRETIFESNCTVLSEITMKCPTPNMTLPDQNASLINLPQRRKRAAPSTSQAGTCDYVWSNTTDFYIGFRLDGLDKYRNLVDELPEFSKLKVTANPFFKMFSGDPPMKYFKPDENNFLQIRGEQLDCAASHLYRVFIGDEDCPLTEIFSNSLTCRPPDETPEDTQIGKTIDGSPRVQVHIDHLRFNIGHLKYDRSIWDDDINKYIIIGVVGGVIIITLLVLCIYCTCRRKDKSKSKSNTQTFTAA